VSVVQLAVLRSGVSCTAKAPVGVGQERTRVLTLLPLMLSVGKGIPKE
jgi:hypothetical protein